MKTLIEAALDEMDTMNATIKGSFDKAIASEGRKATHVTGIEETDAVHDFVVSQIDAWEGLDNNTIITNLSNLSTVLQNYSTTLTDGIKAFNTQEPDPEPEAVDTDAAN